MRVYVARADAEAKFRLEPDVEVANEDFPRFKRARVEDILNLELRHGVHLHWPALDVDLSIDSLEHPERYPLVAEG